MYCINFRFSTSASVYSLPSDDDDLQPRCERAGSEESAHGLETAIECESRVSEMLCAAYSSL